MEGRSPEREFAGSARLLLAAVVLLVVVPAPTAASSPLDSGAEATRPVPIDGCTTIAEPGAYRLAGTVTAGAVQRCLTVTADDVVLDGDGHRLVDDATDTRVGIAVLGADNVSVRDIAIEGMSHGIAFRNASNGTVAASTVAANFRTGVRIYRSHHVTVRNVSVVDNVLIGVRVGWSRHVRVLDSRVRDVRIGISVERLTDGVVRGTRVTRTEIATELSLSDDVRVLDTDVGQAGTAVVMTATPNSVVAGNRLSAADYGIRLENSDGNVIRNNTVDSDGYGLFLFFSAGNHVDDNRITAATDGIAVTLDSDDNAVTANHVTSDREGISLVRSSGNRVTNNTVRAGARGIVTASAPDTRNDGNHVAGHTPMPASPRSTRRSPTIDVNAAVTDPADAAPPARLPLWPIGGGALLVLVVVMRRLDRG